LHGHREPSRSKIGRFLLVAAIGQIHFNLTQVPGRMLVINQKLAIPLKEISLSFSRSGGPGGQNVNKVNSKVTLHWKVSANATLPDAVKHRFAERYKNRINGEGDLVLSSQRFRDQGRNVADCLSKLRAMVEEVAKPPTVRKKSRVSLGAKRRRLENKRRVSEKKSTRKPPRHSD
jgi:ribosome-associated protein